MTYTRKVTKKGQVTIPKDIRDEFGIDEDTRVIIYRNTDSKKVEIKPVPDLFAMREKLDVEDPIDPVKARELMEENYERF